MATKQIRLDNSKLRSGLTAYINRKINVVMQSGEVWFGYLIQIDDVNIIIMNLRKKKQIFPLKHIQEVLIESEA